MPRINPGITLIELILAIVLLLLIVTGIATIDIYSNFHVINSDRRAKIQYEASVALEHMSKQIGRAIGNEVLYGQDTVIVINNSPTNILVKAYVDANGNGHREPPINNPSPTDDHWVAYRYTTKNSPPSRYVISYCGRCRNSNCNFNQCLDNVEDISSQIYAFTPVKPVNASNQLNNNSLSLQITACWDPPDPGKPDTCGTPDNPTVSLNASMKMPAVSYH